MASSIAAARGDASQEAFDRKLTHDRNELEELRQQSIHHRPLVWTAEGRPHPAVTRTLQDAQTSPLGEVPASQIETRNSNRYSTPKGSHGPRSSPESFCTGRVALRRHHRQSHAPLRKCHRS